ncbi:MAG: hypothetical protein KKE94_15125 [Gammaproteobacteria bacterium]|nr:hypothetical protein [Gammaproteobacteria bacterium]
MSYLPLCYLQLQHNYFSSGYLQQASLVPDADCARKLHNAQLIFKATKQGAMLLLDSSRRDIAAACFASPVKLHFLLYSSDAQFCNYSEPVLQQGQLLYCDTGAATAVQQGVQQGMQCLHQATELGTAEIISSTDSKVIALTELQQRPLPVLVLALSITEQDITQLDASSAKHYLLRFGSRRSIWRYYLCGDNFAAALGIRDLTPGSAAQATEQATAQAIEPFVQQADVTLANGRSAKVFDSTKPLALAQQSPYRFALVSQSGGSEKILIKRLPVAAAGQCGMAVVNGVASNVAEIYLNY